MAAALPAEPALEIQGLENINDMSGPWYESIIKDQDDAEAVLQPAISATASHYTSQSTPAIEKAAALGRDSGGGIFDMPSDDSNDASPIVEDFVESESRAQTAPKPSIATHQPPNDQPPPVVLPTPWQAGPRNLVFEKEAPSRPSKGVLGGAFANTRSRSRSAGQEALKRIQKALPSLSAPSHLLPSLPTSFFSNSGDKLKSRSSTNLAVSSSPDINQSPTTRPPISSPRPIRPSLSPQRAGVISPSAGTPSRPPYLRRITSEDSLLYHTLSRASSFGDDDQFSDVREMVNMRLMAFKDSLPEVPNFKMPGLPKIYGQARKSTQSLDAVHSSEALGASGNTKSEPNTDPKDSLTALDRVLDELTGDVVVMGGYRGSILRSAESPHQQLWAPVKIGLNMRKANLEVGLEDEDEEHMEETIIPSGMLKHIGPIDISRKLIKKLRSCENARSGKLRVWDYGYDWRLSPTLLSRKLQEFLQKLPSNRRDVPRGALVIAHSLGGLITRHAVNQRPELFSGVLYAGVPQRCINILGPLRNGDAVLLNEKLLTAQVNFSMRSSFVFLPEDGHCFVDKNTGEEYRIDFYNPEDWAKYRLSPCLQPALPAFNRPQPSALSSFIPNSLRPRSDSKSDKQPSSPPTMKDRTIAPQMNPGTRQDDDSCPSDPERERYFAYLTRTLSMIRKFRSELAHSPSHQEANAYPPFAILYGKSIPTVYAAQVNGREAIPCADCYDELLFRPGDGVALAKEAMLPEGYSLVRGGRICTERGHITMLGDMPAMGRALEALLRGRRKGIGLGVGDRR